MRASSGVAAESNGNRMNNRQTSAKDLLAIDPEVEVKRIVGFIRNAVRSFNRKGAVVALSGGLDSSVVACLCVRALGKDKVFGLSLPERESSSETPKLSRLMIDQLGIDFATIDITPILESVGCYENRDRAIRLVLPEYEASWKSKIVLPDMDDETQYQLFSVVVQDPEGDMRKARLTATAYLELLAAMNFKQRVRKLQEYYHADRLNYVVCGTPNRLEYDQGFFVKLGDGAADVKPIAHLYKTQVYALAEYLEVPEEVRSRPPSTDTYPLPQTQEEFYFSVPYEEMDHCLYGLNHEIPAIQVAETLGWTEERVVGVYRNIEAKMKAARYLHSGSLHLEEVEKGD